MKIIKILILINIFFLQSYLIRFTDYKTNLQEILIIISSIIFLGTIIKEKIFIKTLKNLKNHWIIISLLGLTAISILTVPIPQIKENLDFIRSIKFLFFASILGYIFLETFKTSEERKFAIKIGGIGAIAFGLFSCIYNILGYNVAADFRLLGPLDAAVYLAYYMTPFFLFFTIEFCEDTKKKQYLIFAIILGILITLTRSMGAIGGSFLVLMIYFFKKSDLPLLKKTLFKSILAIIGIIIVVAIFYTKVLPSFESKYSSLNERGEIWKTSVYLLKEPRNWIFGLGFGQFENQYTQNADMVLGQKPLDYNVIQPHNIFLLFIFHYGILGLIFILFCIFMTIKNLTKDEKTSHISKVFSLILLYFFIHGMIDTPFFKNDMMILFIIFLEIGVISNRSPSPSKPHKDPQLS